MEANSTNQKEYSHLEGEDATLTRIAINEIEIVYGAITEK